MNNVCPLFDDIAISVGLEMQCDLQLIRGVMQSDGSPFTSRLVICPR